MALDMFSDLFPKEELNENKILHDLMDSTKNLNMKTRINQPIAMSMLDLSELRFKQKKLKKAELLIKVFLKVYKEYMVSFPDGEGRKEITDTLSSIRQNKTGQSFTERLLGVRKE